MFTHCVIYKCCNRHWTRANQFETLLSRDLPLHMVNMQILIALEQCCKINQMLRDNKGWSLPRAEFEKFRDACFEYGLMVNRLAEHFMSKNRKLFNMTNKQHMICEVGLQSRHLNPNRSWCFLNEDYMMFCRRIIRSQSNGSSPALASKKTVEVVAISKIFGMLPPEQWYVR